MLGYLQTRNIPNLCHFYSSNVLRHIRKQPTSICYRKQFLAKLPIWCMCIDICTLCSRLLWCFTKHLRAQPHQIRSWNYDMISDPEFITKIFKGEEFSWKEVLVLNFLSNKDENFHLFTKFHCLIFLKKVSRPFSY